MIRTHSRSAVAGVVAVAMLFCGAQLSWGASSRKQEGISNFAQVSGTVYRGAQPSAAGFNTLKSMGVSIVVNFRNEAGETSSEQHTVESLGMKYVGIPWSGGDYPSDAKILQFLDLVRANPQAKIFVHCLRGADRTGTMVAAYRIAVEHKPAADAVSEMHHFHYDHMFLPQLQRYVFALPQAIQTNAAFSAYNLAPAPAAAPSISAAIASMAAVAVPVAQ